MKTLMKILCAATSLLVLLPVSSAQDDFRSRAPEAGPARKIVIGDYNTFELKNGLNVIVVENHKLPRISYRVYIDRDAILEGDKAGYTSITGQILSAGTTTRTKAEIDSEVDFVGGSVSSNSYGGFASSLTRHTDVVLELLSDILLNPSFPEDEFDKIVTQLNSSLQAGKDNPNQIANTVNSAIKYGLDHPYGEVLTETTLANISLDDVKNYYNDYFVPSGAYLVVVGDITLDQAKEKAEKYFGEWTGGELPEHKFETPLAPESNQVAFVDKTGAVQSVINIGYPVEMYPGDPDIIPARVMNTVLGVGSSGRLFKNLREDKGYTYGAYSSLSSDELIGSFNAGASVRNEVTDSAIQQFLYELDQIRSTDVLEDDLSLAKNAIAGQFARSLERPQTVANFALSTIRFDLPNDYYATYLERLDKVTAADVREMANKYIHPEAVNIVVVGSQDEVSERLNQFDTDGEVTLYDIYGNERAPAMDAGDITGSQIIEAYISAIGGKDAIMGIESVKQEMTAEAMGQQLSIAEYKLASGKYGLVMSMAGNTMMKQIFDGEKGYAEQMGQRQELDGDMLKQLKQNAAIVPEMEFLTDDYLLEVDGLEAIEGEMAYKVKISDGSGMSSVHYFAKDSGLKLKSVSTIDANGQSVTTTVEYKDYKDVEGFKVPHVQVLSGPLPIPLEMRTSHLELNAEIDPTIFQ